MLLKRLEAYGFKSFADKLEVEFDEGVTAIVGPNGSGKSNITDAIRWVLGEQNVRNLRGTKAEDIIFTGSSTRRALGMAEVSVTFDNTDGTLPLDFQEIMITRRIYRTGESEFLINKTKCRLKDIFNLFADTGLGKNSISVISQNKVDEVLNTKPEERRYFFEECAGITKYRDRKKEAKRKLDATENNLIRLRDIIGEIEKQLGPLEEQAKKTKRYNEIHDDYQACNLTKILTKYESLVQESDAYTTEIKGYQDQRQQLENSVNVSEAEKLVKQQETQQLERQLREINGKLQNIHEEIERHRNRATMLEERISQTVKSQERIQSQRQELHDNHKMATADLAESQRKVSLSSETADKLNAQLEEMRKHTFEIEQQITVKEEALKSSQADEAKKREEIEAERQKLLLLQRDLSDVDANIEAQHQAHKFATNEKIEKNTQRELLAGEIASFEEQARQQKASISSQEVKLTELEDKDKLLGKRIINIQQNLRTAEEKYKLFENMQKAYEGFGKATKKILTAEETWSSGICGAVAELINVEEKYVTAIDIALGNAMQNVVTKDTETAKAAITYLKTNRLGRVTFMPLTTVQPHRNKRQEFEVGKYGFIAYADELVDIDPKYRVITQSLLGRIIIVDHVDNALKLAKLNDYRLRIVTLEGEMLQPGGAIAGGSAHTKESGFLQRAGELADLKQYIEQEQEKLTQVDKEYKDVQAKAEALKEYVATLENKYQAITIQISQKNYEVSQVKTWFKEQEAKLEAINNHISALGVKKVAVEEDIKAQNDVIKTMEASIGEKRSNFTDIEQEIEKLRKDLKISQVKQNQKEISCSESRQEVIHFSDKVKLLQEQVERYSKTIADNDKEMESLQQIIDDSLLENKELERSNLNLVSMEKEQKRESNKIYQRLLGMRNDLENMAKERSKISAQVNELKDKIHKCEVAGAKLEIEIKQSMDTLQEEYQLTPEAALPLRLEIKEEELKTKLRVLEKEMKAIGPVNPNAINEFEALNERYSFMHQQVEDLIKAKDDLQGLIEQIDKTMSTQFKDAFEKIKVSFNDIFKRLFGGGNAKLLLTDKEDILNTGIEIEVEPPDKKPLSMASLSGGERTLTVIALLFAFFSYNPAPFSVLDEIDAPLDEANVKRFAKFLKDYAKRTQFILVTHRKGTMEAANTMYGVTIEDAGVSKLISVRLDDFEERG